MKQLDIPETIAPYNTYIFSGQNGQNRDLRAGVYLGRFGKVHKMLTRTQFSDRREDIGTPRIYNFRNFDFVGFSFLNKLRIPNLKLTRKLNSVEEKLADSILIKKGI